MEPKAVAITAVSWSFGSVAILVVGVRLYTRVFALRRAGWDDFFIALSLASAIVCSSLARVGVYYGLERHINDIHNPDWKMKAFKYTVIAPNFSVVSTTAGKISVTVFLLRLMGQAATAPRRWFLYIPHGSAAFNAFNDLALAVFPAFIFWRVHLRTKMKIAIIAVMGAGILAAAATLVKCVLLRNLPAHADITSSWADITTWYTSLIKRQMYIIIICATLPTLRQSYMTVLHRSQKISAYSQSYDSHPLDKPIPLVRRPVDASLLETRADDDPSLAFGPHSSQDKILAPEAMGWPGIQKTTEVHVFQESRPPSKGDDRPFPLATVSRSGSEGRVYMGNIYNR
ncbi:hypothetical protein P168DRAFT_337137 [Aspergillus campestris IBT 28561]|uniref:Rhodopsin domain-containing protein n=1 Tax=Aspergillus campestris (strain IBT 28561) TaxID=1392248 RepID=A0A2I1CQV9_ASPC2|nr:uncharacterized protein P168DRAFT_337137 [Aspergillus campestris IBT 28561]PKY00007.1 hypothetical protein P168DRAFT_337137 [Aspergillus campestris IBT 28561]